MGKHAKSCANTKCWIPQPQVSQTPTPPVFTKFFTPHQVLSNAPFTLTFKIDNSANVVDATNTSFTDTLPTGLTVASAVSPQCGGIVNIATPGVIKFSGGTVAAGAVCEIVVTMTGVAVTSATYINTTSELTSSLGISAAATATVQIVSTPEPPRKKK